MINFLKNIKSCWSSLRPHRNCVQRIKEVTKRNISCCPGSMRVVVCGAYGKTGRPLSLLLKQSPFIDELGLYDICGNASFPFELGRVDTKCQIQNYCGKDSIERALIDAKVVIIVAQKECQSFELNAPIISEIAINISNVCPNAFTIVASDPVSSFVPLVSELFKRWATYNPQKVLGCIELQQIIINSMLAKHLCVPERSVCVPLIGGTEMNTIVPVLSSATYPGKLNSRNEVKCLIEKMRNTSCCDCFSFAGAYAVASLTINVIRGLIGSPTVPLSAFVDCMTCEPTTTPQYLTCPIRLGPGGIEMNIGIPPLTALEKQYYCCSLTQLKKEIAQGMNITAIHNMRRRPCCSCSNFVSSD